MKKLGISVILPCFNEAGSILMMHEKIANTLSKLNVSYELVFVDDQSQDGTFNLASSIKDPCVKVLQNKINVGLFKSWIVGLEAATYDLVCLIDADGQNPPSEISRLFKKLNEDGADFIQGERSAIGRIGNGRYFLSKGLNFILKALFRNDGNDIKSGFILAHNEALHDILKSIPSNFKTSQSFVKIQAELLGYNVSTVETLFLSRHAGQSFISKFPFKLIFNALTDIVKYKFYWKSIHKSSFLELFLDKYPPKTAPRRFSVKELILLNLFFITYPFHKWMVSNRVKHLYFALRRTQYWDSDTLLNYQNLQIKRMFNHAYFSTSYYRKLFDDNGLSPRNFKGVDDISKIPPLTKDLVNENLYFELISNKHIKKDMYKISTSGSTGNPFTLYVDRFQLEMRMATTMRAWETAGWTFGLRQLRLWHQTIGMTFTEVVKEKIDAILSNRKFIPAFEINENNIEDIKNIFEKTNPYIIDGYAECLNLIAKYQKDKLNLPNLKAVISSAQMLTKESRAIIENKFGAKVIDKYGAREFSGIAYELGDNSGHVIMSESYIINTSQYSDELDYIEITDLNNYCVPIFNYRIGDLSSKSKAWNTAKSEFFAFPRLGVIEGRSQSVLKLSNGKLMPSAFFLHFMKDYNESIDCFQFVQKENGGVNLKLVINSGWNSEIRDFLKTSLLSHLGDIELNFIFVDDIPMIRTGKRLSVISEMRN